MFRADVILNSEGSILLKNFVKFTQMYSSGSFKVIELDLKMTDRRHESGMNLFQIKTSDLDQALSIE